MQTMYARRYMSEIRLLFPAYFRAERRYLRNMKTLIDNYCDENPPADMETIYQAFGRPQDVIANYYAEMGTEELLRQLKLSRFLKGTLVCLTGCIIAFLLFIGIIIFQSHQVFLREEMVFSSTTITIEGRSNNTP